MPVSGLVLTFASHVSDFPESLQQLYDKTEIEVGQSKGAKLAIVVDSDCRDQDQQILNWLKSLPGVELVDVTFVGFE